MYQYDDKLNKVQMKANFSSMENYTSGDKKKKIRMWALIILGIILIVILAYWLFGKKKASSKYSASPMVAPMGFRKSNFGFRFY